MGLFNNRIAYKPFEYPEYYTKPFHGYDDGNMNWKAAMEAEAATLSIAAGYWDKVDPYEASVWMRQNITENIKSYFQNTYDWAFQIERGFPRNVLDIGCSTGISTCYLKENMPHYTSTYGIDLSPYFLSVGTHFSNENNFLTSTPDSLNNKLDGIIWRERIRFLAFFRSS